MMMMMMFDFLGAFDFLGRVFVFPWKAIFFCLSCPWLLTALAEVTFLYFIFPVLILLLLSLSSSSRHCHQALVVAPPFVIWGYCLVEVVIGPWDGYFLVLLRRETCCRPASTGECGEGSWPAASVLCQCRTGA